MSDTLYDRIAFQARLNPSAIAFHESGREMRYARLIADVHAVAARLFGAAELARGSRVIVSVQSPYLHWLVLIACSRLGIVTAAVSENEHKLLLRASAVISDRADEREGTAPLVHVTPDWLRSQASPPREDPRWPRPADDDLARIVLSSGTTGTPKMIGITHAQLRHRLLHVRESYEITSKTRTLIGVGLATLAGYQLPAATWCSGGAVIGSAPQQLLHAWRDGRPNFLMLPPGMLTDFLARSPRALRPDPGLYLLVAGSSLPDALNAEARLRMTSCVYNVYGSTECSTHSICNAADSMGRPGHVGYPVPYADVQVVDEKGQPMPSGEEGEVRVRAPGMATAYLEDDAASREAFRGGWFHPGDTGRIDADGSLTITGRVKELVNDGGVKIAPARIDELARSVEGVFDAAAFASRDSGGDHLCIAVVAGPAFDESELLARYRAAFPTHPKPAIVRVDAIPRNEMGKVQRTRLAQSRTSSTPRQ